ncbi:hypothetical protein ABIB25_003640 [Nakamurella sp. UYEF19]|uniref:DUF6297 family protein n=1 Tax=Nakamurella sp. UYEF19 TaxID=1756392 RepID=UPI0033995C85
MTRAAPVPTSTDPAGFARYLRVAASLGRRRTGTGMRYEIVVAILWFGPAIVIGTWNDLNTSVSSNPPLDWPAAGLLLIAGAALIGLACITIGPVTASREWRAWVLSTPLDRGVLLRRRAVGLVALLVVPGVILGAVLADAAGVRHGPALAAVLLGIAAAISAGGVAMWQQRIRHAAAPRGRGWLWCVVVMAAAAIVVNLRHADPLTAGTLWTAAGTGVVIMLGLTSLGLSGVGLIPLASLAAGSGSVSSLALAVQDQSLAPLAAVLAIRPGHRPSGAVSRSLTGTGRRVVLAMDRRRLLRDRPALVRWFATALLPYGSWALLSGVGWGPAALVVVTFVSAVTAISALCGTVRQFASTPSLADRYGLDRAEARSAAMVIPQIGAVVWGVLTAPILLLHTPQFMAVLVPVTAFAAVAFRARQAPFQPGFVVGQQYSRDAARLFARGPALLIGGAVVLALIAAGLRQRNL